MKLEAVDKRNPMLIRVATVVDVEDYRVKVRADHVRCERVTGARDDLVLITNVQSDALSL